jgi:hypothetical protein
MPKGVIDIWSSLKSSRILLRVLTTSATPPMVVAGAAPAVLPLRLAPTDLPVVEGAAEVGVQAAHPQRLLHRPKPTQKLSRSKATSSSGQVLALPRCATAIHAPEFCCFFHFHLPLASAVGRLQGVPYQIVSILHQWNGAETALGAIE